MPTMVVTHTVKAKLTLKVVPSNGDMCIRKAFTLEVCMLANV